MRHESMGFDCAILIRFAFNLASLNGVFITSLFSMRYYREW